MSDDRHDAFADLVNLLAAPLAGGIRAVDQVRRGTDELIRVAERVHHTLAKLDEAVTRFDALLADVEGPIREIVPRLVRTVGNADAMGAQLRDPVAAVAPKLERVVGSLGQLAEQAGGLFGGVRLPPRPQPAATEPTATKPARATKPAKATKATPKKAAGGTERRPARRPPA